MRLLLKIIIYVLCLGFSIPKTSAQEDSFKILKDRKSVVIPFQYINKNIVIPLTINDSDSLYFIVDSGLTHTLITELFAEDSIQLNNTGKELIVGLGGENPLEVLTSYNNKITMEGIEGKDLRINYIPQNIFNLSQLAGHKINGIIGNDFLKYFIVKIDYIKHKLILYNPKYYRKRLRRYTKLPLELKAGKPYINTDIIAPDSTKKNVKLFVDTGASLALWLMDNNNIHIPKPEVTIYSYIGQGVSGKIYGDYGRIPQIMFKDKKLKNVITSFPNTEDIQRAISDGRNGSIGNEILERFYLILDYPNKQLWLKQNRNFRKPFYFNDSGLDFYQPELNIPLYKILSIRKGSPAEMGGLKIDDIILKANNQSTLTMSLQELILTFDKLTKSKTKEIELTIQRGDSILTVKYKKPLRIL